MLIELRLVEQRYQAVHEVLEGASVTDVARRFEVARQTVHVWLRRSAAHGLAGLADASSKPQPCPHQMAPATEARIVEMRIEHPDWGPRTIRYWLAQEGIDPLPGRTSIERCLLRHNLVDRQPRRKRRSDDKRWERSKSMELWQMDIVGGVRLADPLTGELSEAKIVSGIDDHSRFVVCAAIVARATARPVCDALDAALARHGLPEAILTDNGKVFTARFGPGPGPVLFDRICTNNDIRHILTAPRSPTTTGKVERWHKTLRAEFLNGKVFASLDEAQVALDAWVGHQPERGPHPQPDQCEREQCIRSRRGDCRCRRGRSGRPHGSRWPLSLKLSAVTENTASVDGGGIYTVPGAGSPVSLVFSLVFDNAPNNCSPVGGIKGCFG